MIAAAFLMAFGLSLFAPAVDSGQVPTGPALTLSRTIPLPGVKGRFDHFALDVKGRRLFVAALGNNTLEVIDLKEGKRALSIPGLGKPTGIVHMEKLDKVFVACGDDGNVRVFDAMTLRLLKVIPGLEDADNMRFDAEAGLIYAGYGAGALAAIDPAKAEVVGTIKLKGHPESFQLDKNDDRIFVNVPEAREIAVVDRKSRAVIADWPMTRFEENFPMALDEASHRLYVGCRRPARLVILDTESGKMIADSALCGDIDDLFYDAARHHLYASCGEGFLDVIAEKGPGQYERIGHIPTSAGARTGYFSPELGEFYLAVPQRGTQKAEIRVYSVK